MKRAASSKDAALFRRLESPSVRSIILCGPWNETAESFSSRKHHIVLHTDVAPIGRNRRSVEILLGCCASLIVFTFPGTILETKRGHTHRLTHCTGHLRDLLHR